MVELIKHDNEYVISNTKYISRSNFRTRMFVVARPNPFMHRSISPIMNTNNNIYQGGQKVQDMIRMNKP